MDDPEIKDVLPEGYVHDFGHRGLGEINQFTVPATEHSIECLKDTNPEAYARIKLQIEERDSYPRPELGYAHKVSSSKPHDPINTTVIMKKGVLTEAGKDIIKQLQEVKRNNCPPEEDTYSPFDESLEYHDSVGS